MLKLCKCLCTAYYLRRVVFTFTSHCLGEVCSDGKLDEVQTYCYKRPCQQIRETCMASSITNNYSAEDIMKAVGVRFEVTIIVDAATTLFWGTCFFLIAYFYVKAYIRVRKWSRMQLRTSSVNVLFRANLERRIFRTASWLTIFAGISGITAAVVYFVSLFLQAGYSFRWAETILQLNSLFNPLLYFYRNRQLRKAALEMLKCRKPHGTPPVARSVRRNKQHSLDVEQLEIGQKRPHLIRFKSRDAVICLDTTRRRSKEKLKERPMSAPSKMENDQPNKVSVTGQHEYAPRKKCIQQKTKSPESTTTREIKPPQYIGGELGRSMSLHENSFANAAEKNILRSRSLPILSTNVNAGDKN